MTEKPSDMAIVIVHISNDERLNADETDDFILVPVEQYELAVKTLRDVQKHKKFAPVNTIKSVKDRLNSAKITFEIVEIGTRVYLGVPEEEKPEE